MVERRPRSLALGGSARGGAVGASVAAVRSPWSSRPTLTASTVVLHPFTVADVEAMGPILADPQVLALTGSVHTTKAAHSRSPVLDATTCAWYDSRAEQDDRLDLAVVDAATDACVGEVVLNDWRRQDQAVSFRILLGPAGRDRGLGAQATALILEHAFTASDVHRVELEVYANNPRALATYRRAGFVVEGVQREVFVFDGQRLDAIVMSVLRPEWVARRPA